MSKDRRKSERVLFKRTIKYGETEPTNYGYAYNLSDYGLGIYCDSVLKVGSRLVIEIMLENEFLRIEGEVIWSFHDQKASTCRAGTKLIEYPEKLKKIYKRIQKIKHAKTFY
ncbi:MAG: PilZ domain-containing protein [Candidatus Dadabacteria bacterium]|nr:PilZ domain-containing protein [Candidatus Dadabacteria bacterium]